MRPLLALTASVALTVPLVVAQPAQAAAHSPLSERGLANSSLGAADVPRWMSRGITPVARQTFIKGSLAGAPPLCVDQSGEAVRGRQARQEMSSTVATRTGKEIGSYIYQYRTREAAVRAWSALNSLAAQCEGRVEVDVADDGMATRVVINTEVNQTRTLFGTSGLTLFLDYDGVVEAFDTEFAWFGDSYVSYYLAGTSIVGVAFSGIDVGGPFRLQAVTLRPLSR